MLFDNVYVGRGARVQQAIIDKNVRIPDGDHIGHDLARDALRYTVSEGGRDGGAEGERHPAHPLAKLLTTHAAAPIALCFHGHFYQPPRENPWTDRGAARAVGGAVPRLERAHPRRVLPRQRVRAHPRQRGPHRGDRQQLRAHLVQLRADAGALAGAPRPGGRGAAARGRRRAARAARAAAARSRRRTRTRSCRCARRATRARSWCGGCTTSAAASGTAAEGLWLPETAVSPDTLETLIELGVRYTILAPEQIAAVRALGARRLDGGRSRHAGHGPRLLAGGTATARGGRSRSACSTGRCRARSRSARRRTAPRACWTRSRRRPIARSVDGPRLVLCASDGELWGHHKKFADLTLAFATRVEAARRGIEVTNLGAYLARHPPTWEAQLADGPGRRGDRLELRARAGTLAARLRLQHGRRRTRATRPGAVRCAQALDVVRDAAAAFYEDAAGDLFRDPWARARCLRRGRRRSAAGARSGAGGVRAAGAGRRAARRRASAARRLLELQRATLLMYASCGWFFDDIAGLEARW